MHDRSQSRKRTHAGLPPGGGDDAPDGASIEVASLVVSQIIEQIERILHQPGNAAVIAWTCDDQSVGSPHHFNELMLLFVAFRVFRRIVRKPRKESAIEKQRASARFLGRLQ
jgi:hypothetical protein